MFKSVVHILLNTIQSYPGKTALKFKRDGKLQSLTYSQFGEKIRLLTHGLRHIGIQPGDRIAILSNNMPEWTIADFAAFSIRGVVVPLYQTLPAGQIAYILKDAGVRLIFVENQLQYEKIEQIKKELPGLEFTFSFQPVRSIQSIEYLYEAGLRDRAVKNDFYDKTVESINENEVCSLVYTSGTTGNPKGVMLHHKGFVKDIVNAESVLNLYPDDVFLSFLPLSHLYERLAGHWCPMYRGATIHYAQSIDTVIEDIAEARPTVMVSVPRLYEKVAAAVQDQVEASSEFKRKLFYWAVGTGLDYHERKYSGKSISPLLKQAYLFANKMVFAKVKKKLGGRFRCPIAGGAPLSVDTLKFFEAIGLRIVEGYGMTETHLIITLTPPGKTKYGSCGKPIPEVEVRVAEDGEVLVRGETLMQGYYNKPELTAEMIDEQGWLHTGDIGHLDEDNYLFLTDRKKNIIVTSGGKNVAPAPIEHMLKTSRYIDEVCLVGNRRKFISALIIPNYEVLKVWAEEKGIPADNNAQLVEHEKILALMRDEVNSRQEALASYETVKKFVLLPEPFSIERGELTPSLKVKRSVVEKMYRQVIDGMYA